MFANSLAKADVKSLYYALTRPTEAEICRVREDWRGVPPPTPHPSSDAPGCHCNQKYL